MIKKIRIINLVVFLILVGCGEHPRRTPLTDVLPSGPSLLSDDGNGVIFTANEVVSGSTAQIKVFDYENRLRDVVSGASFDPSSNYRLRYAPATIVIFDVNYNGEEIPLIACERPDNTGPNSYTDLQLQFDDGQGIFWHDLQNMNYLPIISDRKLSCTGSGKSFDLHLFKDNEVHDATFNLYLDLISLRFSGRMVIVKVGDSQANDGVYLDFE